MAWWVFQRIRTSIYNFCKKSYIWLNIWANECKKRSKICRWIIYALTNNAITSEVYKIFLWNRKRWQVDKIACLMIYTFIYFIIYIYIYIYIYILYYILYFYVLSVIFIIFCSFLQFFCLLWLEWAPLWVFQRTRINSYMFWIKVAFGWKFRLNKARNDVNVANKCYMAIS